MPEKKPEQIFKKRFYEAIKEMGRNTRKDPQSMWLTGSLAAHLVDRAGQPSWTELKKSLTPQQYNEMLNSFRAKGNQLVAEDNLKAAFAVEVLALSIIAPKMSEDQHIVAGDILLDKMVQDTIDLFRIRPTPQVN